MITKLIKYLLDAIPKGDHLHPHNEWISVRLDVVQEAADRLDWLEDGIKEWQNEYRLQYDRANRERSRANIAIRHLQAVLNESRSHAEQQKADTAAREWLESIGSESGKQLGSAL